MKMGRFIIDTHVHAQRHAAGKKLEEAGEGDKKKAGYQDLSHAMRHLTTYDNSERLLYDMGCYDVDMCILCSAFGMNNEINVQLVEKYPDKFRAQAYAKETADRARAGEIEWTIDAACEELDRLLSTGKFVGIGEGAPGDPLHNERKRTLDQSERMDQLRKVMDVARKHKVPARVHTGSAGMYPIPHSYWPENWNPYWIHDLATEYPDVTIIFDHGGMQGGTMEDLVDQCIQVASNHDNVYLETGLYWPELYYKALKNPNVGPEKLIWGTDWGASQPVQTQLGVHPQTFVIQVRKQGIVAHQVDVMGWSLKQLLRLDISQDDLYLILGGNALRIYNIPFPLTRMFRRVG
jgi:predicted TIM-barrel fold metal-dependent hydrolase